MVQHAVTVGTDAGLGAREAQVSEPGRVVNPIAEMFALREQVERLKGRLEEAEAIADQQAEKLTQVVKERDVARGLLRELASYLKAAYGPGIERMVFLGPLMRAVDAELPKPGESTVRDAPTTPVGPTVE
jgi:hypothetical protein